MSCLCIHDSSHRDINTRKMITHRTTSVSLGRIVRKTSNPFLHLCCSVWNLVNPHICMRRYQDDLVDQWIHEKNHVFGYGMYQTNLLFVFRFHWQEIHPTKTKYSNIHTCYSDQAVYCSDMWMEIKLFMMMWCCVCWPSPAWLFGPQ